MNIISKSIENNDNSPEGTISNALHHHWCPDDLASVVRVPDSLFPKCVFPCSSNNNVQLSRDNLLIGYIKNQYLKYIHFLE